MRRLLDTTIGKGIVPILATKADNAEGNQYINRTLAKLAYEFELPLWNFWLVVQPLPDHGLRSPEHLTDGLGGLFNFADSWNLDYAWPVRNLSALQLMDFIRKAVNGEQP
jgi:hypothetical protein